ncbi:MAG: VWA domain-containing protein [Woeseia sp.]
MAEAEEVVSDVARHATSYARDLWHRHRERAGTPEILVLADVAARVDLLVTTVFGPVHTIRIAQQPAPPTLLTRMFGRRRGPVRRQAIPATDGRTIWLPGSLGTIDPKLASQRYRTMALQQAMRAQRGSIALWPGIADTLTGDIYLLLEAHAADVTLSQLLPGMAAPVRELRAAALAARPPLSAFPGAARELERFVRNLVDEGIGGPVSTTSDDAMSRAESIVARLLPATATRHTATLRVLKDLWTGNFVTRVPAAAARTLETDFDDEDDSDRPRSVYLERRPDVRDADEDEDDDKKNPGPWMVQADEPHQKAEDPMGVQRPTDRDDGSDASELGEMLSELHEARLVTSPGRPKEVLLSDDPPHAGTHHHLPDQEHDDRAARYPEWNYRTGRYREAGATVQTLPTEPGSQSWVDRTLEEHRSMLQLIRRRFEMLQARRVVLRRQLDGEEIDFDTCVNALADLKAGTYMPEGLYQRCRPAERNLAIMLLIDVSGSTDGWVSSTRRIIDVEREALLLVCIALKEMDEPYAVLAFSGRGPQGVTVRPIKDFDEPYSNDVAIRISSLEPERYTRAGAAIRHATAMLMQQAASHRLLLLLSDGKPNDIDEYEGRYGAEDMRQAVNEARLQGLSPFCLTIDRQAASYLPRVFGANQYAMLPRPELLPTVLLDWMRRLLAAR